MESGQNNTFIYVRPTNRAVADTLKNLETSLLVGEVEVIRVSLGSCTGPGQTLELTCERMENQLAFAQ